MTSSPAVTSFFPPPPDPLSSAALVHQTRTPTFDWSQAHDLTKDLRESDDRHESRSQQHLTPIESNATPLNRRPSAGLQRMTFSPSPLVLSHQTISDAMKSNPKSAAPREPFVREDGSDSPVGSGLRRLGNRWSFNGSEKIVEPAVANWDLVDEIGRLQIGNGGDDGTERITTPLKNAPTEILQIHETSPLETSSSDASLDSISPPDEDRLTLPSHSRGSSTDTSSSDNSSRSHTLVPSFKSNKVSDVTKDRPRSFNGTYSDADLRGLQQAGIQSQSRATAQEQRSSPSTRDINGGEEVYNTDSFGQQPTFPSLTAFPYGQHTMQSASPTIHGIGFGPGSRQDDLHVDHNLQPRHFINGQPSFASAPAQGPIRHAQTEGMQYRQQPPPRGVNMFQPHMQMPAQGPPALLPSPTNFGYPGHPNAHGHHNSHLSLGNSQQLYEMMLPPLDAAVTRAQQTFRGSHHHSASDPATLRDAAALLLSNGMHSMQGGSFPGPNPGMYAPMGLPTPGVYPNQFYPGGPSLHAQEAYNQDMINALGRVYNANGVPGGPGSYGVATNQTGGSNGPSANNRKLGLYKTELCRSWEEKGTCRYGPKCQFAHGEDEIRKVARHPKYKTEICRTFWVSGSCPYGKRCCFIHTELPASGAPPGADGNPPPPVGDGRARSMSTNSDPNDAPVSLLARIAKRNQDATTPSATTPVGGQENHSSQMSYQFSKPPTGSLRVDTTVLDSTGAKQNKSAYPSFASNSVQPISPGPVTAGPDFGRHNSLARVNGIDMNHGRMDKGSSSSTNPRHSFNGTEAGITLNTLRSAGGSASPFGMLTTDSPSSSSATASGHGHGHSRSGSAGNWASFSAHKGHLAAPSPYSHSPSPGHDMPPTNSASSPWGTSELNKPWP